MSEQNKAAEQFQKASKDGFEVTARAYGEANQGFQAIASEVVDYSKSAFEDATRAFEQLLGAKTIEQVIEIQSQYAKKAYDAYVSKASKLTEMYLSLTLNAYRPVEQAIKRRAA